MKRILVGVALSIISVNLGAVLNRLAIAANGGQMPVFGFASPALDGGHKVGDASTRLRWLADQFVLLGYSWSVGDALLLLGLVLAFIACGRLMLIALTGKPLSE